MKKPIRYVVLAGIALLFNPTLIAQEKNHPFSKPETEKQMKQVLIDKIFVPGTEREAFIKRMNVNRDIIKKQRGFVKDEVYEQKTEDDNLIFITIAVWENSESIKNAKEFVEAEYKRTGFNMKEFCQLHRIKLERSIYNDPSISQEKGDHFSKAEKQMQQVLIGNVTVPVSEKEEFIKRLNANNEILRNQKGFVKDVAYEQQTENNSVIFFTVVIWKDPWSIKTASEAVDAEYQRTGFNLKEFCQNHAVKIERGGIYHAYEN